MRYHEIISEAPLASYDLHGDFDQEGSFGSKDRKLLSSPRHPERIEKLLRAGKTQIAVTVANIPQDVLNSLGYAGPEQPEQENEFVRGGTALNNFSAISALKQFGETTPHKLSYEYGVEVKINPAAINVVLLGNFDGADALTAWMIIHRLTHAIEDGATAIRATFVSPALRDAWSALAKYINRFGYDKYLSMTGNQLLSRFTTMRSSPPNNELINEILTQYLVKGRAPLKMPEATISANPKSKALTDFFDEEYVRTAEDDINRLCAAVEAEMIGKLFSTF